MLGMETIQEIVETAVLTSRVKNARPVSLLLIAPPECGKTSIVTAKESELVKVLSDTTGKGLLLLCQFFPNVSHIVINDMIAVSGHRPSVSAYTVAMLSAIVEEGVAAIANPDGVQTFPQGTRKGVIACVPEGIATDRRAWWSRSGFASRLLPVQFRHSHALQIRINIAIQNGLPAPEPAKEGKLVAPAVPVHVDIPEPAAVTIHHLAMKKAAELGEVGYRRHHQYRAMAAAHVLWRRKWKDAAVGDEDLAFIERMHPFVSYKRAVEI